MPLQYDLNLKDPDGTYAAIIDAHGDLTDAESAALNARLVLLLANHIGDAEVLRKAIEVARTSLGKAR
ncbi:MAG: DUF2783 domain-containing protein [Hyphomicrobiaceae bacterium]|nr:MAG: DUF2783 domain-containing protein [Hyphomicrobiaceae bacterium]